MRPARLAILALTCACLLGPAASAQAKVGISLNNGILTLSSGKKGDRVAVACTAEGNVQVNGRDPVGAPLGCGKVTEVDAVMGAGNDRVNFAGIDGRFATKDFPGFGQGTGAAALLGPGDDTYVGSATAFNLVLTGSGDNRATGGAVRDSLSGAAGEDILDGHGGRDLVLGKGGADTLAGGPDDDLISGNAGDDLLIGGAGADFLGGGLGIDRMLGGPGNDRLIGGAGKDRLNGGGGRNELIQDAPKK